MVDGKRVTVVLMLKQQILRDAVRCMLETDSKITVVGSCSSMDGAITLIRQHRPDVFLWTAHEQTWQDARVLYKARRLKTHIVIMIPPVLIPYLSELASRVPMYGYIVDTEGRRQMLSVIKKAATEEKMMFSEDAIIPSVVRRSSTLTLREREVFYWISHGQENAEIAERLKLSEKTIKNHVSRILKKLELNNRTQIAIFGWQHGIPQIPAELSPWLNPWLNPYTKE